MRARVRPSYDVTCVVSRPQIRQYGRYGEYESRSAEPAGGLPVSVIVAGVGTHLVRALRVIWETWIDSAPYFAGWYWTGPGTIYRRTPR